MPHRSHRVFLLQEIIFPRRAGPCRQRNQWTHLCPLSASASITHSGEHPEQNRWALSPRNCWPRVRHLAGLDDRQLLIASCWQFDLFSKMERAHHLFTAIFARSVLAQETAAALLCRGPPNSGKWTHRRGVDEREHCPVVTKHERKRHHPRGDGRITRPGRFTSKGPSDTDYQLSPTQPIARRSETAPVVRVKSPPSYGSTSTVA